jgi:dTDP-4-amino-4,6-dideoxygalactose transaminase
MYLAPDTPLTLADLASLRRPALERGYLSEALFFASGRAALLAGLKSLGIGPGDEVLLPAYLCESVVTPVEAAGARPVFFPTGCRFEVDLPALEAAIGPRTRAVVVIHYLGFPGPVEEVRALCQRRSLALIEDCAHALYGRLGDRPLGSFGDLAIFSPWKSLPLPDGGLLAVNQPGLSPPLPERRPSPARTAARLGYRALGAIEQAVGWSPRLAMLQRPGVRRGLHQQVSARPVESLAGSHLAERLLRGARSAEVVGRRRRHFERLLGACRSLSWATPIFSDLPPGVCPLGLPLVAEGRDRWRDRLLRHGVNVRTYWEQLPPAVDVERFPDAAWLRDRILILPVHQGLSDEAVEWLARLLPTLSERT